jgi:hypothetical protein
MPATVSTTAAAPDADVDDDVSPAFWVADRLPASARVADRVLSTCRAAGCASLTDRRPSRSAPIRQVSSTRRFR